MNDTPNDWPIDDESEPEDEQDTRLGPPSRLDRLMGAKDRADKEAEHWSEIEQRGTPVPSHNQDYGETQPVSHEPPRQSGDTPTGQDTPPEGLPPVQPSQLPQAPKPKSAPPEQSRSKRPSPSFPHPTDRGMMSEPPVPNDLDQGPAGVPRGGQPHRRYQPPAGADDVRLDANGMPLPKKPPRVDPDATIAGTSSYTDEPLHRQAEPTRPHGYDTPDFEQVTQPAPRAVPPQRRYVPPPPPPPPPTVPTPRSSYVPPRSEGRWGAGGRRVRRRSFSPRMTWGCIARTLVLSIIGGIVALMLTGGASAMYYARVTAPSFRGIRSIEDLQSRALQFETTRIRDRDGNILYEINDPEGGRREYVTLDEVSPWVIVATVATEERDFFTNPGFSIPAIIRAVVQNYREGEVVSGASTITQQLTRMLLLPEEERYERSYSRKVKEIFLAAELGRRFTKRDILELYLNQAFYGNFAYGIEAAAQTYFGKSASELNMAEAAFLAGLPQAPAVYDPVSNREGALGRQQVVLGLMLEAGCVDPGNSGLPLQNYCITDQTILDAQSDIATIASTQFQAPTFEARYPHWVVYIQQLLEGDPTIGSAIYTSGFDVYTTLDPRLQDLAQQTVRDVLAGLTDRNVHNASVVIIDPETGALLAMVGSADFYDENIDGQVNVALTLQQPGSSIKPFTYLTSFREGWTPGTVIWDVPIAYEIPGFGVYEPVNYDGRFRGPVTVRYALANSLNVPAVLTLDYAGIPDLLQTLKDVGITTLGGPEDAGNYGLSLTLGAGEVKLLEWTNAFATIANGGQWRPPYAIERIERNGQVIAGYPYQVPAGQQVLDPAHAHLIRDILSDKVARIPAFGENSVLSPPYPAGAKTGTTNDFVDNWTMGFTTEMAVGVWVGNTNNDPMINVSGVTGAGPIWRGIMDGAQAWYPAQPFPQPPNLVFQQRICRDDGTIPSDYCLEHSEAVVEIFDNRTPPPGPEYSIYREVLVDQFTGLLANDFCPDYTEERAFLILPDPSPTLDMVSFERNWLVNTSEGQSWAAQRAVSVEWLQADAPTQSCDPNTPRPQVAITNPTSDSRQSGMLIIQGTADVTNFSHYYIEYGLGPDPQGWGSAQGPTGVPVHDGPLGQLDLSQLPNGQITIRLVVVDQAGHQAEQRVIFNVENPAPTPVPAATDEP